MTQTIVELSIKVYTYLLPFAWIALIAAVIILLPLSLVRRTRAIAGTGMLIASWIIGITTWFLGAAVTFATWGWLGFLIGLLLFGVGVVPIGIAAAIFSMENYELALSLFVMAVITISFRLGGYGLIANIEQRLTLDNKVD